MAEKISEENAHQAWKAALPGVSLALPGDQNLGLRELTEGVASGYGGVALLMSMLDSSGAWAEFIKDAPVNGIGNRVTTTDELMKTMLACVLVGGNRYNHVEHIKRDYLLASLIKTKFCGADALGRGLARLTHKGGLEWAGKQLSRSALPALRIVPGWAMDLDTSAKTLYGTQEGAEVGYNPHKKGHRGHALHLVTVGGARLILQIQVLPGNQMTPCFGRGKVMELLDELIAEKVAPRLVRGDVAYGNDEMMKDLESRKVDYLFRLKMSKKVSDLCRNVLERRVGWEIAWQDCGKGYRGCEAMLKLQGWEQERRVIILARPKARKTLPPTTIADSQSPAPPPEILPHPAAKTKGARKAKKTKAEGEPQQLVLDLRFDDKEGCFVTRGGQNPRYQGTRSKALQVPRTDLVAEDPDGFEFMVLVTSMAAPASQVAQEYRQRADSENPNDQIKNQQAIGGFTSDSLETTRLAMSLAALFHNWWTIFARCIDPEKTTEQITGQPAVIATPVIKRQDRHGRATLHLGPVGNHPLLMLGIVAAISFFSSLKGAAAQPGPSRPDAWSSVCAHAFRKYLPPVATAPSIQAVAAAEPPS